MTTEERKQSESMMGRSTTTARGPDKTEGPVTREELRSLFQSEQMQTSTKTWTPTVGGILAIVAGYLNIFSGILMTTGFPIFAGVASFVGVGIGFGILLIVLGIISVIGGYYAIRRRSWGMALAGSIAALFPSFVLVPGVLSLIFVALGKPAFKK